MTLDFGFVERVRIGDLIWLDRNADGIQQDNERGIKNVIITLRDKCALLLFSLSSVVVLTLPWLCISNEVIARTTTDANGEYEFSSDQVDALVPRRWYTLQISTQQVRSCFCLFFLEKNSDDRLLLCAQPALSGLQPTTPGAGSNVNKDSNGEFQVTLVVDLFCGLE